MNPAHVVEAMLFASRRPLSEQDLAEALPPGTDVRAVVDRLSAEYEGRGVMVARAAGGWALRTRPESSDLAGALLAVEAPPLTRAQLETLAVIAALGPVTRPEIERVRGVSALARGIMDALLERDLVRPGPRRDGPGRPLTWTATVRFMETFDLDSMSDVAPWVEMVASGLAVVPPPPVQGDEEERAA